MRLPRLAVLLPLLMLPGCVTPCAKDQWVRAWHWASDDRVAVVFQPPESSKAATLEVAKDGEALLDGAWVGKVTDSGPERELALVELAETGERPARVRAFVSLAGVPIGGSSERTTAIVVAEERGRGAVFTRGPRSWSRAAVVSSHLGNASASKEAAVLAGAVPLFTVSASLDVAIALSIGGFYVIATNPQILVWIIECAAHCH